MKVYEENKSAFGGMKDSRVQSISLQNVAKATYFLRDRIYSDKRKAAFCESLCNAVDEHRKHNVKRPVDVYITNTALIIRDYAQGLDKEDVLSIFFQYFESTKSHSNDAIGGFGIGAKAPGAYSDMYYVTSFYNGTATMFVSAVNGYESTASVFHTEECGDETGICVHIPIKNTLDREYFCSLANDMYIQMGLNSEKSPFRVYQFAGNDSLIGTNIGKYVAEKNVPSMDEHYEQYTYRLNDVIRDFTIAVPGKAIILNGARFYYGGRPKRTETGLGTMYFRSTFFVQKGIWAYDGDMMYRMDVPSEVLDNINTYDRQIILLFNRGELSVAPSREVIEVNDYVVKWVKNRFNEVMTYVKDNMMSEVESRIKDSSTTMWHLVNSCLRGSLVSTFANDNHEFTSKLAIDLPAGRNLYTQRSNANNAIKGYRVNSGSSFTSTTLSLYQSRSKVYFILNPNKRRVALTNAVNSVVSYVDAIEGMEASDYIRDAHIIYFETEASCNKFLQTIEETDNPLFKFRKNIDYFMIDDTLGYSSKPGTTYTRKSPVVKTTDLSDLCTSRMIEVEDIGSTLIYSPSDLTGANNDSIIARLIPMINNRNISASVMKFLEEEYGIKHVAECYKNSCNKFYKMGAKNISILDDIDEKINNVLKTNNVIFITYGQLREMHLDEFFDIYSDHLVKINGFLVGTESMVNRVDDYSDNRAYTPDNKYRLHSLYRLAESFSTYKDITARKFTDNMVRLFDHLDNVAAEKIASYAFYHRAGLISPGDYSVPITNFLSKHFTTRDKFKDITREFEKKAITAKQEVRALIEEKSKTFITVEKIFN